MPSWVILLDGIQSGYRHPAARYDNRLPKLNLSEKPGKRRWSRERWKSRPDWESWRLTFA